jgi:malonyl-CoA O-methyltransferase
VIDQSRIRRAFARAAAGFDTNDFLHREVRERLLERLVAIAAEPSWIIDLGAGTGGATPGLMARFPGARVLSLDSSPAMLDAGETPVYAVCGDASALPLADGCADLVFSNLMLHHCPDPTRSIAEIRRVLADSGLLMFTTFGAASFIELGRAWATADRFTHIAPFFGLQALGNLLSAGGFTEPVLDRQSLTITYDKLPRLMQDLRNAGSSNATTGRARGLTGRAVWQRLAAAYDQLRNPEGKLPVTLDIVFGLAWAGNKMEPRDEVEIPIDTLRTSRRSR